MTLFEHLGELRRRLIICILAFVAFAIVTYVLYGPILTALKEPYCHALQALPNAIPSIQAKGVSKANQCHFVITQPLQGFAARLNVTAYGGLVLGLPVILYELWQFVTPGLKAQERRYAIPFVFASVLLFAAGGAVAYFIYQKALIFLISSSGAGTQTIFSPNSYLSLLGALILIFGIAFEFPVVLVALVLAGAISTAGLRSFRRWAVLLITVFAAVVTPSSDPFSMLALAVPLVVFYEGSILVGRLLHK
jgi:sec-independent protein translocase protein TatC